MAYAPQNYESLNIMDLYCSVQEVYEEDAESKEKRKARRRQKAKKKHSATAAEPKRTSASSKTLMNRRKSSSSIGKGTFRNMTSRRRHSIAVPTGMRDGGENKGRRSSRKSTSSEGRRKMSMVSQLKDLNVDCIARRTRRGSQPRVSLECKKITRRYSSNQSSNFRSGIVV